MESLLSWLMETEGQMKGGMETMDKTEKTDSDDQLTQQLELCKVRRCIIYAVHHKTS